MPRNYCTVLDVEQYLPLGISDEVQGDLPETDEPNWLNPNSKTVTASNLIFFINQACRIIDGALSTQYDVPLRRTNIGGDVGFPDPVPTIAAILAADLIFEQRLLGTEKQQSDTQKERKDWAYQELDNIQNGERRLIGQRYTRGDRFVRGTLRNTPNNPAHSGESKSK